MNNTIIKIKLFALSFLISGSIMAQQKLTKVSQSIKVDKDVVVDLNTSYSNIIIDTWNKNTIEIEAYIEGEKLSKEEEEKKGQEEETKNPETEGEGNDIEGATDSKIQRQKSITRTSKSGDNSADGNSDTESKSKTTMKTGES